MAAKSVKPTESEALSFGQLGQDPLPVRDTQTGVKALRLGANTELVTPQQFWLYEFPGGDTPIIDPHKREPLLAGSDDKPDVRLSIELEAFNFGEAHKEDRDPKARASLRLDVGKDKGSTSNLDLLLWSTSSAIDLAQQIREKKKPKDLAFRGNDVFKRRPIEIPGGLGAINLEVIKHKEPSWWAKVFKGATGSAAQDLIRTLGFPGITSDVLQFVNNAFGAFEDNNAEIIFQSRPLTVAVTQRAKSDFTDDNPAYKVASLNRSRYLIVRRQDIDAISAAKAVYVGGYGMLAPKEDYDRHGDVYDYADNPLNKLTYGVLRVRTKEVALDQSVEGP